MENKNITNMTTSIIDVVILIPLMILEIIYAKTPIQIIFVALLNSFLMIHYILKSIYFFLHESRGKEVLYRILESFFDISTTLIIILFLLELHSVFTWILLGIIISYTILEILFNSFHLKDEVRYIIRAIKGVFFCFLLISLYPVNLIVELGLLSVLSGFSFNVLGRCLNNKLIQSLECVSIILFGLFMIFLFCFML